MNFVSAHEKCLQFVESYKNKPIDGNIAQDQAVHEELNHMKFEIQLLRNQISELQFEVKSWRRACEPNFATKSVCITFIRIQII